MQAEQPTQDLVVVHLTLATVLMRNPQRSDLTTYGEEWSADRVPGRQRDAGSARWPEQVAQQERPCQDIADPIEGGGGKK